jgi:hypothetical protein
MFSGRCVVQKIDAETGDVVESFGNYSFTADVLGGGLYNPRQPDRYAIKILNSNGALWRQIGSPERRQMFRIRNFCRSSKLSPRK